MALSRTAKFYRDNPAARKKHRDYQAKYNKKRKSIKQRVEDNKKNRQFGTYGNYDGLDVSHKKGGKIGLESHAREPELAQSGVEFSQIHGQSPRCGDRSDRGSG